MCGRFSFAQLAQAIADSFNLTSVPEVSPRYNISPTQEVATILNNAPESDRECKLLYWGLIPSWAKDPKMGAKLINARAETIEEKPSFRSAFKKRRCLILADGFYEWQLQNGKKQPYYFRVEDGKIFAFAGLWEHWKSPEGEEINSCTIITTEANDILRPIHDRMPVILEPKDYEQWLDIKQKPEAVKSLLQPYRSDVMTAYAVSAKVNNPKNDSRECIEKLINSSC